MKCPVAVLALCATACCGGDDTTMAALKNFEGTWKVVECQTDNADAATFDKEWIAQGSFAFQGDRVTLRLGEKKVGEGTFKLDLSKKPKVIEVIPNDSGERLHGIFEIEGGTLKLCLSEGRRKRPTEFKVTAEQGNALFVLKKQMKK